MTFAISLGRAIGATASYTVHSACVLATATGRFGEDIAIGTTTGYVEHSARLAAIRAHATAERPASIALVMKPRAKKLVPA